MKTEEEIKEELEETKKCIADREEFFYIKYNGGCSLDEILADEMRKNNENSDVKAEKILQLFDIEEVNK